MHIKTVRNFLFIFLSFFNISKMVLFTFLKEKKKKQILLTYYWIIFEILFNGRDSRIPLLYYTHIIYVWQVCIYIGIYMYVRTYVWKNKKTAIMVASLSCLNRESLLWSTRWNSWLRVLLDWPSSLTQFKTFSLSSKAHALKFSSPSIWSTLLLISSLEMIPFWFC